MGWCVFAAWVTLTAFPPIEWLTIVHSSVIYLIEARRPGRETFHASAGLCGSVHQISHRCDSSHQFRAWMLRGCWLYMWPHAHSCQPLPGQTTRHDADAVIGVGLIVCICPTEG